MKENNLNERPFDVEVPLSIGDAKFNSKINEINDDDTLLKFCKLENKNNEKLNGDQKGALVAKIKENILSQNKNLSIKTIFELSILLNGKVKLKSLYGIDISELDSFKFGSLKPIFDFIKKHKKKSKDKNKHLFYIDLIYDFLNSGELIENYCAKDFFDLHLLNFTDTKSYNKLSCDSFERIVDILQRYLEEDEYNKEQIIDDMYNILEFAPSKFLYKAPIVKLLECLKNGSHTGLNADKIHKVIERLITLDGCKFSYALMILSYCKNNSVPGDIFKKAINHWAENKQDLFKSFSLKIPKKKLEELNKQGKNVAEIENKYNKYIFTPSLINFIKQKFNFDENYDLEQVLKINFGEDNFAEGDNCDLEVIMYRLFFEDYMLVPHKKEDVIKLFETTKFACPPYNKNLKKSFYSDFVNIWDSKTVQGFFSNMNILAQEIIYERCRDTEYFTLADLKIIVLSGFKFGDLKNINKNYNTCYFFIQDDFFNQIPNEINEIYDKYYFRWVLQVFRNQPEGINKRHLINLLKHYKFNDRSDFDDFCLPTHRTIVVDCYCLGTNEENKIQVESDVDILSALLDSCDDKIFLDNQSNPPFDIQKIISSTKNQKLIDKMNNKFNSYPIKKQNEILMSNNNHSIIENPNSNDDKIFLDNQSNPPFDIQKIISSTENQKLIDKTNNKFNSHSIQKRNEILMSNDNHSIIENPNSNNGQSESKTIISQKYNERKTPRWLIVITFGGVFWVPWLFKKMFGCCYNFDDGNIIADKNGNKKISNQNPKQNQDNKDNKFEESLFK